MNLPSHVFTDGAREPTAAEAAVLQAMHALSQACIAVDVPALQALTAGALSYSHGDGRIQNQADYIAALVEGQSVFRQITLSAIRVQLAGDVALVQHHAHYSTFIQQQPGSAEVHVGQVWQHANGGWRLLLRNARKAV
ncbi:nuclear transport factor 2 family protein [Rhodoferax sp.]|uniref:nuclear transport factor 2 family protein n=1 Tax=Rhodoferax sp. TaxID=50421 RepID=UPI00374CE8E5